MLNDHLFEWYLARYFQRQVHNRRSPHVPKLSRRHFADVKTNIDDVMLAYDDKGKLNLADVKPLGFLVKSQG